MATHQSAIRRELTSVERSLPLLHTIDPGFVHIRKIESLLSEPGIALIDSMVRQIPDMPEGLRRFRVYHAYTRVLLDFCRLNEIPTLEAVMAAGRGQMFCSTEELAPCPSIDHAKRAVTAWIPRHETTHQVDLQFSPEHIISSTLRQRLCDGGTVSIIAISAGVRGDTHVFEPLVIGFPYLKSDIPGVEERMMWWSYDFYEHSVEDIDEFSNVTSVPDPQNSDSMRQISESAFKQCLAKILGGTVPKDWGGEQSDFYSSHIHLGGRRTTAAFLLKGPSHFSTMEVAHLGKNGDQIYRLASEPAELLVVQHSHDIGQAVRSTLRAFAVQPSNPRRYCFIDGRDSLRLLQAYGLYDRAVALSQKA